MALASFTAPRSIPRVVALQVVLMALIADLSLVGVLRPDVVPAVPEPRSGAAWALFAVGLLLYGAVAVRAPHTYLLTRRAADLTVVVGLVLLAAALYGAMGGGSAGAAPVSRRVESIHALVGHSARVLPRRVPRLPLDRRPRRRRQDVSQLGTHQLDGDADSRLE
jgi:hypothetical protein